MLSACTDVNRKLFDNAGLGLTPYGPEDGTCAYGYDLENRVQTSQWKSPSSSRATKARQSRSNINLMMIVFLNFMELCELSF
jgi:hypothetical protein